MLNIWLLRAAAEVLCMVVDMQLAAAVLEDIEPHQDLPFLQVQLLQSPLGQGEVLQQVVPILCFQLLPLMVVVVVGHQKSKLEPVEALGAVAQVILAAAVLVIIHQQIHRKAVVVAVLQVKALLFILTMAAVVVELQPLEQPLQIQVLQLLVLGVLGARVQHHQFLVLQ
jgi:hypothetical protein